MPTIALKEFYRYFNLHSSIVLGPLFVLILPVRAQSRHRKVKEDGMNSELLSHRGETLRVFSLAMALGCSSILTLSIALSSFCQSRNATCLVWYLC